MQQQPLQFSFPRQSAVCRASHAHNRAKANSGTAQTTAWVNSVPAWTVMDVEPGVHHHERRDGRRRQSDADSAFTQLEISALNAGVENRRGRCFLPPMGSMMNDILLAAHAP
jgi:hypothetical protein